MVGNSFSALPEPRFSGSHGSIADNRLGSSPSALVLSATLSAALTNVSCGQSRLGQWFSTAGSGEQSAGSKELSQFTVERVRSRLQHRESLGRIAAETHFLRSGTGG